jgi:quinol monooxygenase YgiN
MADIIEIRSYNLKPGQREEFHRLFRDEVYPMLKRWGVDVVAFGPSPQDDISYYLIRRYNDQGDLEQSQDAFYGSDEWRQGPREPVLACIENFTSIVLIVDPATLQGLRQTGENK